MVWCPKHLGENTSNSLLFRRFNDIINERSNAILVKNDVETCRKANGVTLMESTIRNY